MARAKDPASCKWHPQKVKVISARGAKLLPCREFEFEVRTAVVVNEIARLNLASQSCPNFGRCGGKSPSLARHLNRILVVLSGMQEGECGKGKTGQKVAGEASHDTRTGADGDRDTDRDRDGDRGAGRLWTAARSCRPLHLWTRGESQFPEWASIRRMPSLPSGFCGSR